MKGINLNRSNKKFTSDTNTPASTQNTPTSSDSYATQELIRLLKESLLREEEKISGVELLEKNLSALEKLKRDELSTFKKERDYFNNLIKSEERRLAQLLQEKEMEKNREIELATDAVFEHHEEDLARKRQELERDYALKERELIEAIEREISDGNEAYREKIQKDLDDNYDYVVNEVEQMREKFTDFQDRIKEFFDQFIEDAKAGLDIEFEASSMYQEMSEEINSQIASLEKEIEEASQKQAEASQKQAEVSQEEAEVSRKPQEAVDKIMTDQVVGLENFPSYEPEESSLSLVKKDFEAEEFNVDEFDEDLDSEIEKLEALLEQAELDQREEEPAPFKLFANEAPVVEMEADAASPPAIDTVQFPARGGEDIILEVENVDSHHSLFVDDLDEDTRIIDFPPIIDEMEKDNHPVQEPDVDQVDHSYQENIESLDAFNELIKAQESRMQRLINLDR